MAHPSPHNRAVRCAEPACVRRPVAAMPGLRRLAQLRAGAVLVLVSLGAASPAGGADPPQILAAQLGDKTLSAVAYVPGPPGAGGGLQRLVLQAYLAPDGSGLVRQWVIARNNYSPPERTRWSLADDILCIGLPSGP